MRVSPSSLTAIAAAALLMAGCYGGQTVRPYAVAVSGNAQHGKKLIEALWMRSLPHDSRRA